MTRTSRQRAYASLLEWRSLAISALIDRLEKSSQRRASAFGVRVGIGEGEGEGEGEGVGEGEGEGEASARASLGVGSRGGVR